MGRTYFVAFENVAVAAAQDFFEITPAANKPVKLISVAIAGCELETSEQLRFQVKRLPATVTSGSGGSTPTPRKALSSDTAAGFGAEMNNTARATTSGTVEVLHAEGANAVQGFFYAPAKGHEPVFINGEALIVGLEANPSGSTAMSGTLIVEELS